MLELDPDLDLEDDRPLEDSLGDTSRDPLLLQMMSCMFVVNGGKNTLISIALCGNLHVL